MGWLRKIMGEPDPPSIYAVEIFVIREGTMMIYRTEGLEGLKATVDETIRLSQIAKSEVTFANTFTIVSHAERQMS